MYGRRPFLRLGRLLVDVGLSPSDFSWSGGLRQTDSTYRLAGVTRLGLQNGLVGKVRCKNVLHTTYTRHTTRPVRYSQLPS